MLKVDDAPAVEVNPVHEVMDGILKMETNPPIFKVYIEATDHTDGFTARCVFRDGNPRMTEWTSRGDSPEEAVYELYRTLLEHFGPCPHCGRVGPI
jgi:hypothetical protein